MFLHKFTVPDLKASTLAVDANRRIIVADSANRCIHVISLDTGHYNSSAMKSERCTVIPGCLYYTFFSVNLPWDILWIGTSLNRSFPRCFQVLIKTNKRISSDKIGKPLSRPIRVKQSPFVTCLCVFFPHFLQAACTWRIWPFFDLPELMT